MSLTHAFVGFTAALVIATITSPVGISGAVFLLPVQLSILQVPTPAVTPTNLMFNVVATPGALVRYWRQGQLDAPLTRRLVAGTLPGVVIGAAIHVYLAPGPRIFRLLAAGLLLPTGVWLLARSRATPAPGAARDSPPGPRPRTITILALVVGVVGGIYGIGGGSILGPILVGSGMSVAAVAPAALCATFLTSAVGAIAYSLLALTASGTIGPNVPLGLICGFGGLLGGYVGARVQSRVPERILRLLLGALAIGLAIAYVVQAAR